MPSDTNYISGRFSLVDFIRESNRIEGIHREPSGEEYTAHHLFLRPQPPTVELLFAFVRSIAPGHLLRDKPNLNVRVGNHIAPRGGPDIVSALNDVLAIADPYDQHVAYETLHPFTDGNGRSGRALWLWSMGGIEAAPLGFLHHWYYQTLQHAPARQPDAE